jgi:hypothetical protein
MIKCNNGGDGGVDNVNLAKHNDKKRIFFV